MLSSLLFPFALWITIVDGLLFKPRSKCVPTTAVYGPCHKCVCSTQGMYHCWHKKCDNNETETTDFDKECEPSLTYIEKGMICSCSSTGDWRSSNCRNRFRRIQAKKTLTKETMRTNFGCTPNKLYLVDCNICRCEANGILRSTSCTKRPCSGTNKAATCKAGDIERFGNELCACSDANYFIDKLCMPINKEEVQIIEERSLEKLVYADQPWRRNFEENYKCHQNMTFTVDCNTCVCKKNRLECTNHVCSVKKVGRSNKYGAESLPELKDPDEKCKPGKKYKYKCNICVCADDGSPTCTNMVCLEDFQLNLLTFPANISNIARTMPKVSKDQKCVPGQRYKIDCNTCICKKDGNLMCTKILCLPDRIKSERRQNVENITVKLTNNTIVKKKTKLRKAKKTLPPILPETCVPGKIYRNKACQACICEDNKKAVCSQKKNACKEYKKGFKINYLKDLRPPFKPSEVDTLPELPHRQEKCKPGKYYRVECNSCVCLMSNDLICDELICLNYDEMHRLEADEKSKNRCDSQSYVKTIENCVECDCVKNKMKCHEIVGCISESDKKLPNWNGGKPKLALDMFKETCMPGGVYRMDCNNCYCQDDMTLRCTQKTCLNYSQSKALENQRMYLIQYDL